MGLEWKKGKTGSFYVFYPEIAMHSPFRRYSMIILREDGERESVETLLEDWNLKEFALREKCVIAFPNPQEAGWEACDTETLVEQLRDAQSGMCEPDDYVFETDANGIPLLSCMLNRWHLMNDTRYYVGIGEGAQAACRMALEAPREVAAVCCICGKKQTLPEKELEEIGMPFRVLEESRLDFEKTAGAFLRQYRRINTGKYGDTAKRMDFEKVSFDIYENDDSLGDHGNPAHTWFVHVPSSARGKLPVMLFFHGGSDNPAEAAEMSRFHELGEKEGFITVYPWGSDTASWNCNYAENGYDDVAYIHALIDWLKRKYPVDETRIYLSGFSNGAAMAQVYAMEYPEEIAGVCHIDSNWPGHRLGPAGIREEEVTAFQRGKKRKEEYDFRMPIWYTYGTGEPSYPVYRGCSQQLQYDFWKEYNHIPVKETPKRENPHPCGCGVPGDMCEELIVSDQYPEHRYQVNRFYSDDATPMNLYNYVMMHDKGHEVAPFDPLLGWNYVKQFRRNKDGSLSVLEGNDE